MRARPHGSPRTDSREGGEVEVVVATVNGRAYYDFVQLLGVLDLRYSSRLPWEVSRGLTRLLLTTAQELPNGYDGDYLLHEQLTRDRILDSARVLSRLLKSRRDTFVVGLDPGENTGIACLYRGYNLFATSVDSLERALDLVCGVLQVEAAEKLVRIGRGDRPKAYFLARGIRDRCAESARIEMVDERGTTKTVRAPIHRHGRRDAFSALLIAKKPGSEFY
jgi:hypothetical protein